MTDRATTPPPQSHLPEKKTKRRRARGSGSVYRMGRIWWIAYRGPDGRRAAESSESQRKSDAERLLEKKTGAVANNLPVVKNAEKLTFADAADNVVNDYTANGKKTLDMVEMRLDQHLKPYFRGWRLASITAADVTKYITHRMKEGIRKFRRVPTGDGDKTERKLVRVRDISNASINRELQLLRRIFSLAKDNGTIGSIPKIALLAEDNVRQGFFEPEHYASVLKHLPEELRPVVTFGYLTGWRINSEVLPLEWRQVDFAAGEVRLEPGTTKNKQGRTFPFTANLRALLLAQQVEHKRLEKAGHIVPHVFFREVADGTGGDKLPERIRSLRGAWKTACQDAGCPGRIPHDLRRTAVRNLVRDGVTEGVAMKMTGHKTRSVFERYNIISGDDLRDAARKIDRSAGRLSNAS